MKSKYKIFAEHKTSKKSNRDTNISIMDEVNGTSKYK